jgi:hypothetical protein
MRTAIRSQLFRWAGGAALLAVIVARSWRAPAAGAQPPAPVLFSASVAAAPLLHAQRLSDVRRAMLLAQQGHAAEREQPVAAPLGIVLEWAEVPMPSSDVARSTGDLTLRLLNLDRLAYVVQATIIGDAGSLSSRARSAAVSVTLPEDALQELRVATTIPAGIEWSFSGAIAVHMRACPIGAGTTRCLTAVSDPVYFHPVGVGTAVRFYGEQALAAKYASGALRGPVQGPDDSTMTLRVMGGGPLTVDPATDTAMGEGQ